MRVRLDLGYDGTGFSGWAAQPDRRTVQGELTAALRRVLRVAVELTVAGRTDAGVHATGQVAHVDVPAAVWAEQGAKLVRRLAGVLPADVRVRAATAVPATFDARFGALWRCYEYRIADADGGVPPLRRVDTVAWARRLDLGRLSAASWGLLGTHDFAAYCKARPEASSVRELQRLDWRREADGILTATVQADAFCHHLVRGLVGALLAVGDGRRPVEWPAGLLDRTERAGEVGVAPAAGLTLVAVGYPADPADNLARQEQTRRRRDPVAVHDPREEPGVTLTEDPGRLSDPSPGAVGVRPPGDPARLSDPDPGAPGAVGVRPPGDPVRLHDDELSITGALVARLVAEQWPDLADRPLRHVPTDGTVNVVYRVGEDAFLRLPRSARWADDLRRELEWLPRLAAYLPVAVPTPLRVGRPTADYPVPWAMYDWLPGAHPRLGALADPEGLALDLASVVLAVRRADLPGPPPGGVPTLADLDDAVRRGLDRLDGDAEPLRAVWDDAVARPAYDGPPVRVHGDLMPGNLLLDDAGRLSGVLDWGALGSGDPAADLLPAWFVLPAPARATFRAAVGADDDTWARGRARVLAKIAIGIPYYRDTNPGFVRVLHHALSEIETELTGGGAGT